MSLGGCTPAGLSVFSYNCEITPDGASQWAGRGNGVAEYNNSACGAQERDMWDRQLYRPYHYIYMVSDNKRDFCHVYLKMQLSRYGLWPWQLNISQE